MNARCWLLLAALALNPIAAASVPMFDVVYRVEVRGIYAGRARQWVEQRDDGTWVFQAEATPHRLARIFGAKRIHEESVMELDGGLLRTLSFHSTEGRHARTRVLTSYDHKAGVATVERERVRELEVPADALDRLGLQLALIQDLSEGGPREVYRVVMGAELYEMRFERIREEEVTVPAGIFPCVLYERTEDRPGRMTRLWIAPSLGFIPVRMVELRDGNVRSRLELERIN